MVGAAGLDVLPALVACGGIATRGVRQRAIEVILRRLEPRDGGPQQRLRRRRRCDRRREAAGEEARLQLPDGVPALGQRQIPIRSETALDLTLVELVIVKGSERPRQPAERPDEPELRGNQIDDQAEPHLPREGESALELALRVDERIAGGEDVRVELIAAVGRVGQIADPVGGLERATQEIPAALHVLRPWDDEASEDQTGPGPEARQPALFDQVIAEPPEAVGGRVVAEARARHHGEPLYAKHEASQLPCSRLRFTWRQMTRRYRFASV